MVISFKKFFNWLKLFFLRIYRIPQKLTKPEWLIIAICLSILIGGGYRVYFYHPNAGQPTTGGELIEGIVAQTSAEVDKEIDRLTIASLVRFDEHNNLQPYLAKSWSIGEDHKTYTLIIDDRYSSRVLVDEYNKHPEKIAGVELTAVDDRSIKIELKQSFGLLLENLTQPFFQAGPYKVIARNNQRVELVANEDFIFGRPYIDRLTIVIFPNDNLLKQALQKHEVTSALVNQPPDKGYQTFSIRLPRYIYVFYNLKRSPLDDKNVRRKLSDKQPFDNPIALELTVGKDPEQENLAKEVAKLWQSLNVNSTINSIAKKDFPSKILENHDYQTLIYGIDLGRDADQYALWHSTQIGKKGQNIAQFENSVADKLLEQYRLTTDQGVRSQKSQELQKILDEEKPAMILKQIQLPYQVSKKIKGVKIDQGVAPSDRFQNVWEWYIRTK